MCLKIRHFKRWPIYAILISLVCRCLWSEYRVSLQREPPGHRRAVHLRGKGSVERTHREHQLQGQSQRYSQIKEFKAINTKM